MYVQPGSGRGASPTSRINGDIERHFRLLKEKAGGKIPSEALLQAEESTHVKEAKDHKEKKTKLNVVWVDHIGKSLISSCPLNDNYPTESIGERRPYSAPHLSKKDNMRRPSITQDREKGILQGSEFSLKRTYKEALLGSPVHPRRFQPPPPPSLCYSPPRCVLLRRLSTSEGRCFRCLAKDHQVQQCRDPIPCAECFKTGHILRNCRTRSTQSLPRMA